MSGAPKGTASDGKTELFNVPGYPLMVRAVDFNRLHAENERLAALVEAQQPAAYVQNHAEIEHVAGDVSKNGPESNKAQQPAKAESLRQILTDPENQPNQYGVQFLMHGAKMAFRIGNRQFCLDYEPDEPGEFEFMRDALISAFSVFTPDVKMAQQPAPSAAAAGNFYPHAELRKTWQPGQRWQARSFRNGQWGPWTDAVASEPFWFPHQDYRRHPDDLAPKPSPTPQAYIPAEQLALLDAATCEMQERTKISTTLIGVPTPQADSQPAPDEFQPCPSCFGKGVDGDADDYGRTIDVTCGECDGSGRAPIKADSQPAPVLDEREAFEAWFKREYHSRLCRNMPDKSYNDPMAYSTWIGWQARAARAPADSVTAPAEESRCANCGKSAADSRERIADYPEEGEWFCSAQCKDQHDELDCPHLTHNGYRHPAESERLIACERALRSLASWLSVGGFNAPTVDAKVFEEKIRWGVEHLLQATPPAQAADSVLEDAARLWDAFVETWRNELGVDKIVNIMGGADKLKAVFLDAARKQGANHD